MVVGGTCIPACVIVGKEQGKTSRVLTFANASSEYVPPMVIHKGKKVPEMWLKDKPVGVTLHSSDTGWINKASFLEYATQWNEELEDT